MMTERDPGPLEENEFEDLPPYDQMLARMAPENLHKTLRNMAHIKRDIVTATNLTEEERASLLSVWKNKVKEGKFEKDFIFPEDERSKRIGS